MLEKVLSTDTGEICFGAACVRSFEGQSNFDKYYIDREVKKVVKKIGEGEEDFIIEDKIIEHKRDIAKEIHAQAGDAGIDSYLKNFEMTGINPFDSFSNEQEPIQDFTKFPKDLADSKMFIKSQVALFESLPKELRKDMTPEEFVEKFDQAKFDAYIRSLYPPKEQKKGESE